MSIKTGFRFSAAFLWVVLNIWGAQRIRAGYCGFKRIRLKIRGNFSQRFVKWFEHGNHPHSPEHVSFKL